MKCIKCHGNMKPSKGILQGLVIHGDFPGDDKLAKNHIIPRGRTISRSGPARLVPVWKCSECGHSITREI